MFSLSKINIFYHFILISLKLEFLTSYCMGIYYLSNLMASICLWWYSHLFPRRLLIESSWLPLRLILVVLTFHKNKGGYFSIKRQTYQCSLLPHPPRNARSILHFSHDIIWANQCPSPRTGSPVWYKTDRSGFTFWLCTLSVYFTVKQKC